MIFITVLVVLPVLGTYQAELPYAHNSMSASYLPRAFALGSNGTYNVTVIVYTGLGNPVQGSVINLTTGKTIHSERTNSRGYANFYLHGIGNSSIYYGSTAERPALGYNYSTPMGNINREAYLYPSKGGPYFFNYSGFRPLINSTADNTNYTVPRYEITRLSRSGGFTNSNISIYYEGMSGVSAPEVLLYYEPVNQSVVFGGMPVPLSSLNESNMTFFGKYSGSVSHTVNPANITATSPYFMFALFTPSGKALGFTELSVSSGTDSSPALSSFFGNTVEIYELLLPVMACLMAYYNFGRERMDGTLDSILIRPLNRTNLISSRILAGISSLFVASVASLGITSAAIYSLYGVFLPTGTIMLTIWVMLVEISAFASLIFLASMMTKSQTGLIGAIVGLFLTLDFLWSFRPLFPSLIISATPAGSLLYNRLIVALYYISPAGLTQIATGLSTGIYNIQMIDLSSFPGTTGSDIGVSLLNLTLAGIVWIIVPAAMAIIRYTLRD